MYVFIYTFFIFSISIIFFQTDEDIQKNNSYVFSTYALNWQDSVKECEKYGGSLVQIDSAAEMSNILAQL